jgi:hypothetical protein
VRFKWRTISGRKDLDISLAHPNMLCERFVERSNPEKGMSYGWKGVFKGDVSICEARAN